MTGRSVEHAFLITFKPSSDVSCHYKYSTRSCDGSVSFQLPLLEVLVQYGADLDARTKNGETPYGK